MLFLNEKKLLRKLFYQIHLFYAIINKQAWENDYNGNVISETSSS